MGGGSSKGIREEMAAQDAKKSTKSWASRTDRPSTTWERNQRKRDEKKAEAFAHHKAHLAEIAGREASAVLIQAHFRGYRHRKAERLHHLYNNVLKRSLYYGKVSLCTNTSPGLGHTAAGPVSGEYGIGVKMRLTGDLTPGKMSTQPSVSGDQVLRTEVAELKTLIRQALKVH